jgi:hypothetical protein
MTNYSTIDKCPITGNSNRVTYFDLGLMPLVNNLNNTKEEFLNIVNSLTEEDYYS